MKPNWPTKKLEKTLLVIKDFLRRVQQFWLILLVLTILTIVTYYLWRVSTFDLQDLWINLSAGFITLIGTLFVVDVLLERQKRVEWQEAHDIAKSDLQLLSNMLVSHLGSPLGISILNISSIFRGRIDQDQDIANQIQKLNHELLSEVRGNKLQQLLVSMAPKDWRSLQANLVTLKHALSETVGLYKERLSPEVLGKLLSVNSKFSAFYKMFSLVPELFTQEENEWPPNRLGQEENRRIRADLLKFFERDLKNLFAEIEKFIMILDNWK